MNMYRAALMCQSACNSQALLRSLVGYLPEISKECNGTQQINSHPVVKMFLVQLVSLAGLSDLGMITTDEYHELSELCEKKALEIEAQEVRASAAV